MNAKTKKAEQKVANQFYQACNCRAALEVYLQPFLDAKKFADHLSPDEPDAKKKSSVKRPRLGSNDFGTGGTMTSFRIWFTT